MHFTAKISNVAGFLHATTTDAPNSRRYALAWYCQGDVLLKGEESSGGPSTLHISCGTISKLLDGCKRCEQCGGIHSVIIDCSEQNKSNSAVE
jgi:hypothetical protein